MLLILAYLTWFRRFNDMNVKVVELFWDILWVIVSRLAGTTGWAKLNGPMQFLSS